MIIHRTISSRTSRASRILTLPLTMLAAAALAGGCGDDDPDPMQEAPDAAPEPQPDAAPEPSLLDRAVTSVGGVDALLAAQRVSITGKGERFEYAEGYEPEDDPHRINTFTLDLHVDLASGRARADWTTDVDFLGATFMLEYSELVAADAGAFAGCDSIFGFCSQAMLPQRTAAAARAQRLRNPHLSLRHALENAGAWQEGPDRVIDGVTYHTLVIEDEWQPIALYLDLATDEIALAGTADVDHSLGDVELLVRFGDWFEADGLRFPGSLSMTMDGVVLHTESERSAEVDAEFAADLFAPLDAATPITEQADYDFGLQHSQWHERWAAAGIALDASFDFVTATEIVAGSDVYLLGGALHNTLAVELDAGIVLVDAPYHDRRSQAILAKVEELWPGKPVTHLVLTHFHDDHTAGTRGIAAAGADIVVSEHGVAYFTKVIEAEHALAPDALAKSDATPAITPVTGTQPLILGTGERTVEVWPITTTHARDLVAVYVPHAKTLFETDLYSPNPEGLTQPLLGAFATWSAELSAAITATGLDVELIAGGHGSFVTLQQFLDHLAAQPQPASR
jgi:glyoxylase-like metal-dependent hydrolase (beta-lactamase superfamily II)